MQGPMFCWRKVDKSPCRRGRKYRRSRFYIELLRWRQRFRFLY